MEIITLPTALNELNIFSKNGEKVILKKIAQLIEAIQLNPYEGVGKPEQLKHHLTGYWSRRINREHRLVYNISENVIYIYSVKGHYW